MSITHQSTCIHVTALFDEDTSHFKVTTVSGYVEGIEEVLLDWRKGNKLLYTITETRFITFASICFTSQTTYGNGFQISYRIRSWSPFCPSELPPQQWHRTHFMTKIVAHLYASKVDYGSAMQIDYVNTEVVPRTIRP